jgi:hypothetical protein
MNSTPPPAFRRIASACRQWLLAFLFIVPLVRAAPAWQAELTSPAPGAFAPIVPTALDFEVTWNGMLRAGIVHLEFNPPDVKKPGITIVRTSAASLGAAAVLFPYQTNFWSEIVSSTLRPRYFHAVETDSRETVDTVIQHFPDRSESREVSKKLKTGLVQKTERTFTFSPVFDMFSAMLHVRSQKLDDGDHFTLAINPFDTPYLLRVKVVAHEVHEGRKAIRLSVGMRRIDRKTMELRAYKKLKQDATLWLSDDADRIPIDLRAAAFIGEIRATLVAHRKP